MKKALTTATALLFVGLPAFAGKYEYEVDRFDGTKTASFFQKGSGCTQTEGVKGHAEGCLFINSTESSAYPRISVQKVNKGWELLHYKSRKTIPAIVTMTDGSVRRMNFSNADLHTSTIYGGTVAEWVGFSIGSLANQIDKVRMIEVQYGSAEFKITPNKQARCAIKRLPTCN
jgi:hypothetical protein